LTCKTVAHITYTVLVETLNHAQSINPAAWNCLSDELHEPLLTANSFRQLLKTRLFAEY